ncbi:MAG: ABC transporter permease [Treponema sp.]|jgi:ABC-type dipeptide/oligopeptide/nickel transport system permease component|nr:ABC transporter permease [Treponema sp.]
MHFIARRLVLTLVTLFLVSAICFLAFSVIRGDPASLILGTDASVEQVTALREEMGLNRSLPERYLAWLGNFLSGNLGNSVRFRGESVSGMIRERLPVTFSLAFLSLFFILAVSFPAALFSVRKEGGFIDRLMNAFTAINISVPGFFLGVLFIWIFGISLRFFSPGAYVDYRENFPAFAAYLVFPALAITLPNAAILVKFLRASLFREQRSDYVRTARSKGASRRFVLYRHVLRNAVIPALAILGMITAEVFSGSIVIEQVFTIPGIGRLLIMSITSRDYPLIQTLVVYIAFVVIIANTLVDIAIQLIDPRIRLEAEAP